MVSLRARLYLYDLQHVDSKYVTDKSKGTCDNQIELGISQRRTATEASCPISITLSEACRIYRRRRLRSRVREGVALLAVTAFV